MRKIDRTGETRTMNNGLVAEIATYRNCADVDIRFVDSGQIVKNRRYYTFKCGEIKCPLIIERIDDYCQVTNPSVNVSWLMDYEDIHLLGGFLWHEDGNGYVSRAGSGGRILLHREIMNTPKGMDTDHISTIRTDNRKSNLRICTRTENTYNTNKKSNNKSGFKGVCFHGHTGKWVAEIAICGKKNHLGLFRTAQEAAKAYDLAAIKYHGEFARLNILGDSDG